MKSPVPPRTAGCILAVATLYALVQFGRGVYFAVISSADLKTLHTTWEHLVAGEPVPSPYLPPAYLFLTPVLAWGLTPARVIMFGLNLAVIVLVWRKLTRLMQFTRWQEWLWLALFMDWTCVRLTLGHGQTPLLVLGAAMWVFPERGPARPLPVTLTALKHSLSFPLFLHLLLRHPRTLWLACLVVGGSVTACMVWLGLGPREYLQLVLDGMSRGVTGLGSTDLSHLFVRLFGSPWGMGLLGVLWLGVYARYCARIQDPTILLAALLIMSLWPVYHRSYDLVVLAPALALVLKYFHAGWAILMSALLAGGYEHLHKHGFYGSPLLKWLGQFYYPTLLLVLLGVLIVLDRKLVAAAPAKAG